MNRNRVVVAYLFLASCVLFPRPAQASSWSAEKLPKSVTGTVYASGNNTVIAATDKRRIKVCSYALLTNSTTTVVATFQSGASGTGLWTLPLQSTSSSTFMGANLAIPAPTFLFATAHSTLLNLNLSSGNTVYYSISYWDDDAN